MLAGFVALPLGQVAAGPLAERFGEQATLIGGAVLLVLTTGLALLSRDVRSLERRVSPEDPPVDRSATG